jgi:hypothetical protein
MGGGRAPRLAGDYVLYLTIGLLRVVPVLYLYLTFLI